MSDWDGVWTGLAVLLCASGAAALLMAAWEWVAFRLGERRLRERHRRRVAEILEQIRLSDAQTRWPWPREDRKSCD